MKSISRPLTRLSHSFVLLNSSPMAIGVLVMGLYPKPFTDVMQASVTELLKHVSVSKLN